MGRFAVKFCIDCGKHTSSGCNKCQVCRLKAVNPYKLCSTTNCCGFPGLNSYCMACRKPAGAKTCGRCGFFDWHTQGQAMCYMCAAWKTACVRQAGFVQEGVLTEQDFHNLMRAATVCPDTGHIFVDGDPRPMWRRSMDRLDNTKGYVQGNVRVVSLLANVRRGTRPIEMWRAIVQAWPPLPDDH